MTTGSFRIQFKIQTDQNSSEKPIQHSKSGLIGQGGKIPAQGTQVDLAVDLGLARSTGQSTWVTRVDCQVDTVSTGLSTWPQSQVEPSPPWLAWSVFGRFSEPCLVTRARCQLLVGLFFERTTIIKPSFIDGLNQLTNSIKRTYD